MRVVQINCLYSSGSTGKIVAAIHEDLLRRGDDSYVLYGMGETRKDSHIIKVTPEFIRKAQSFRSRLTGYPYGGCIWGTAKAISHLKRIKPDIVHLQCANGYMVNIYRILEYLKKEHIPTVITNHAEFMYTGGCTHAVECKKWLTGCYECKRISKEHPISYFFDRTKQEWELFRHAYKGFEDLTVCCVSDWVRERAEQSPFFKGYPVVTILNGLDTDVFHMRDSSEIKKSLGLEGKKIILHVTPNFYSVIKGGEHVLEMARRCPEYEFVIVGSEGNDDTLKNCHFVGKINDQKELSKYYSMADVCLLTSVRETFSMVCAESLCCGTVVVGFEAGGPEKIALPQYSQFVEQGNDDSLEVALRNVAELFHDKKMVSEAGIINYGQKTMCENYYSIYRSLYKK